MSRPSIGVVIATPGRASLLRTLNSIEHQGLIPGDDVIVVGDGYHQPTKELVELMGPPFRYVATTRTRDWGHSQVNYGLQKVGGDWVIIQDDDDVFLPRAFDEARTIIEKLESPRPIIGRVMTPYLGILWKEPGAEPLDGHCLVVPNNKEKLGYFGLEYAGDQKWLASNLAAYDTYTWADRIWTLTRPKEKLWPRRVQCSGACAWTFHQDQEGVWTGQAMATLTLVRPLDDDRWSARLSYKWAEPEELREIVEFAAWAGQGTDVWFKVDPLQVDLIDALHEAGYEMHEVTGHYMDFVFEWPPHEFVPRPK